MSSFIDKWLVSLIVWIGVAYASYSVLTQFITLSSCVLSIIGDGFLWDEIYSLILIWSVVSSLILALDSESVTFLKIISVLNEL